MRRTDGPRAGDDQGPDSTWSDLEADLRTRRLVINATGAAAGLVLLAVVAVVIAAAVPDPPTPEQRRSGRQADVNWDGLDDRTRNAFVLLDSRVSQRPTRLRRTTTMVQDASRDYAAARAAQIRDEIAAIDGNAWRTDRDVERRRDLAGELSRLRR